MPISGLDLNTCKKMADNTAEEILKSHEDMQLCYTPFNPSWAEDGHSWEWYLARDIQMICEKVDVVFMAPGWNESLGCRLEHEYAKLIGKDIVYIESGTYNQNI